MGPQRGCFETLTATTSQAEHSDSIAETPLRAQAQRARVVARRGAIARARCIAMVFSFFDARSRNDLDF